MLLRLFRLVRRFLRRDHAPDSDCDMDYTTSPPKTINDIPPEVFMTIIEFLPQPAKKDLYSLCLTSGRLGAAATPYLYKTVVVRASEAVHGHRALLWTVTGNAVLARQVLNFAFAVPPDQPELAPSLDEYIQFLQATLPLAGDAYLHSSLTTALKKGSYSAESALALFTLAPTLRHLDIHRYQEEAPPRHTAPSEHAFRFAMLFRPSLRHGIRLSCATAFENLTGLCFVNTASRLPFECLLFTLELPKLEKLFAQGFDREEEGFDIAKYSSSCSPVKTLMFRRCDFDAGSVAILLDRCQAIDSLELDLIHGPPLNRHTLSRTLNRHAKTLGKLLFYHVGINDPHGQLPEYSLQNFTALRELRAGAELFSSPLAEDGASEEDIHDILQRVIAPNLTCLELNTRADVSSLPSYLRAFASLPRTSLPGKLALVFHGWTGLEEVAMEMMLLGLQPAPGILLYLYDDIRGCACMRDLCLSMSEAFEVWKHGNGFADEIDDYGLAAAFEEPWEPKTMEEGGDKV